MAVMNQWGDEIDESIGDVTEEYLEGIAKEKAEDLAEKGAKEAKKGAVKAGKALDKALGSPIGRLKAAIQRAKKKVKDTIRKFARQGIKALWTMVKAGAKALAGFIASHPVIAAIIFIILLCVIAYLESDHENNIDNLQSDEILQEGPTYVNTDGMSDDDIVVVLMGDCIDQQYDTMTEMIQMTLEKEEQAKDIYTVFHDYGFNNVTIAGILANIDIESALDSSAIEGIFSEYGILGTKKAAALLSIGNYTENTLFPLYKSSGVSINRDGYKTTNSYGDTIYYCGLGFIQWTGPNAKTLLTAAENLGVNWYDKNFQLGYMINDNMYRPGFFSTWKDNQPEDYYFDPDDYDPADYLTYEEYETALEEAQEAAFEAAVERAKEAAVYFAHGYEGNTGSDETRKNAAVIWYTTIFEWGDDESDDEYADSITALAGDLAAIAQFFEIEEAQYRCLGGNVFDNSSLSSAGMSLAWPRREMSFNNGTNLYQTVLKTIWPHNYVFKACDRTVAAAVVWSGTDIDFPIGNTATQMRYMETSPKWMKVGSASSLSIDDLQPGDIFCLNGHTFMYASVEGVQAAYKNEANGNSDSISGSLNKRSAACDNSTSSILSRGGQDWEGRGVYNVYRCIDPDDSDKWSSIGSGMTN